MPINCKRKKSRSLSLEKVKVNISRKPNKLVVRERKIEVQSLGKVNWNISRSTKNKKISCK